MIVQPFFNTEIVLYTIGQDKFKESLNKPFDKLRANGNLLISFVVSLSNHDWDQLVRISLKVKIARNIFTTKPEISAQDINESVNVCLRKFGFIKENAYVFADNLMRRTTVVSVDEVTIRKSTEIAINYQISNWEDGPMKEAH